MVAALAVGNLVRETSGTTGTGNQTLTAINGKRTFNTEHGTGGTDLFDYFIFKQDAAEWERGTGHLLSSAVRVRDTVIESSNSDALVSFTTGTKVVTNDLPASFHGGQWNLLATATPSAVAIVDIIGLTSEYFVYKFIWSNLKTVTNDAALQMRTSTDNGATFDTGGTDYSWANHKVFMQVVVTSQVLGDNEDDALQVGASIGHDANEFADLEITLFNPTSAEFTKVSDRSVGATGATSFYDARGAGMRLSAVAVNAVQFLLTAGNISSGTVKMYGIRA